MTTLFELAQFYANSFGGITQSTWAVAEAANVAIKEVYVSKVEVDQLLRDRMSTYETRLLSGEPLQYVLGHWSFRNLDLICDRRALIPRPETELLVERVFERLSKQANLLGLDLGTGTGAIGLSLASSSYFECVFLGDVSLDALSLAFANLVRNTEQIKAKVEFGRGEWFEALPGMANKNLDVVVSNPPYIPTRMLSQLDARVKAEPKLALDGGSNGMSCLIEILNKARRYLRSGGLLACEIGEEQGEFLSGYAADLQYRQIEIIKDYSGKPRYLFARASS